MTFAHRRNQLMTHFSERIPIIKRHIFVYIQPVTDHTVLSLLTNNSGILNSEVLAIYYHFWNRLEPVMLGNVTVNAFQDEQVV